MEPTVLASLSNHVRHAAGLYGPNPTAVRTSFFFFSAARTNQQARKAACLLCHRHVWSTSHSEDRERTSFVKDANVRRDRCDVRDGPQCVAG